MNTPSQLERGRRVSPKEFAELIGVSLWAVYKLIKDRKIPYIKLGAIGNRQSAQRRHEVAVTRQQRPGLQPNPTQPSNSNHPQQQAEREVMKRQRQTATGLSVEFGD